MKTQATGGLRRSMALAAMAMLMAFSMAHAEERASELERRQARAHQHFDDRFAHDRFYFERGYVVRDAPRGAYVIAHGPEHFWYDRGEWYRRSGAHWVVTGAPLGIFVPVLPPFYTTVWFGGLPYYYANETYYIWDGAQREYEVVASPPGIDSGGSTQPPRSDELFVYPKDGQSSEQQSRDRYECHHSAVEQAGYDPTQQGGGVSHDMAPEKRSDYFRAETACLEARGYSVR